MTDAADRPYTIVMLGRVFLASFALMGSVACSGAAPDPRSANGTTATSPATPAATGSASVTTNDRQGMGGGSGTPTGTPAAGAGPVDAGAVLPDHPDSSAASSGSGDAASSAVANGALATFHAALDDLQCGRRKDHVRIAWLGDSHAQADFWTDAVRVALQRRFGDGGPGFVHVGYRDYRHAGVSLHVEGKWRNRPKQPASTERYKDGSLGLGGILTAGYADQPSASVELTDADLAARPMVWDLCTKLSEPGASLRVQLTGAPGRELAVDSHGGLRHTKLTGQGRGTLQVVPGQGRPELCGVVIEAEPSSGPGVVLDNLGINGARYATALAWDEGAWSTELSRRKPELVVIEYGGNEAGDFVSRPEAYGRHLTTLVARIRKVRADVSCVVVGLAEREDGESRIASIRDAQREAARQAGCMFWDTYEVMGGRGSMRRWRDEKKAAPDGIHLMPKGYAELGARLHQDLVSGAPASCGR